MAADIAAAAMLPYHYVSPPFQSAMLSLHLFSLLRFLYFITDISDFHMREHTPLFIRYYLHYRHFQMLQFADDVTDADITMLSTLRAQPRRHYFR